jgi:hypothetical protein
VFTGWRIFIFRIVVIANRTAARTSALSPGWGFAAEKTKILSGAQSPGHFSTDRKGGEIWGGCRGSWWFSIPGTSYPVTEPGRFIWRVVRLLFIGLGTLGIRRWRLPVEAGRVLE